ncbi:MULTISPECIES: DUF58 domain-containing protein [Pseudomonadati]|uniref:DUF58 domain-containing protein n=1 Tax=Shewanella aestuarii TaxID=1028752 RepID=A0ABT0KY25_9GAMM|nr:DUF58 domain-containing protein [Shewanella aestuarii]MCL1116327.1 DUF58 domain-containing protein [Shewanella aestuarii]GGN83982.1 DUF58 domain-containing protein [Shewanella aestuarii]
MFSRKAKTKQTDQSSWLMRLIPDAAKRKWSRWIGRRLPPQEKVTLSHKGIFILPSAFGLAWLALIVLLYLLGTNYQNNLVIGLSLLLASVFHTCILYSYKNLAGLTFNAISPADAYAEQAHTFPIMLSGHAKQKHRDTTHQQICMQFIGQRHIRLQHTEEQTIATVQYDNPKRGLLTPGRIKVWSHFPLGLFKAWSYVDLDLHQVVFAAPLECDIHLTSQAAEDNNDISHGKIRPGVDDYTGLRSYVAGESLKQVAWKQWAQDKGMLTKEFNQPEGAPVWLSLADTQGHDLEQRLSKLSWQVNYLAQKNQIFGLIIDNQTLTQSSGESHRIACQKALALYRPSVNFQSDNHLGGQNAG